MSPVQGIVEGIAQRMAVVYLEKADSHAGFLCSEDIHGGGVDGADVGLLVQHHQSLLHVGGDLNEFIGLALELAHLGMDLQMLLIDPAQQGGQFLISIVGKGLFQV